MASNAILNSLNKKHLQVDDWIDRNDFDGDIQAMLYPSIIGTEKESYATGFNNEMSLTGDNWDFKQGKSVEESIISTKSNNI